MYNILIVDDDLELIELLKLFLEKDYKVLTAQSGHEALEILEQHVVDIGIFDIMMPKMNGYELISKVRKKNLFPVIFISAKSSDTDKILGLDLGADDYITKPYNPLEVLSRVKSNLRRAYELKDSKNDFIESSGFRIDLKTYKVSVQGKLLDLTSMEYKIMLLLLQSPGQVFTKEQIADYIHGFYCESDDHSITVHISNIREKVRSAGMKNQTIKTIRGVGYKIEKS